MKKLIRPIFLAISCAALAGGVPLAAQSEGPLAPRVEEEGKTYDLQLQFSGHGNTLDYDAPDLRNPEELESVEDWFGPDAALFRAFGQDPSGMRSIRIALDISADGTVASCDPTAYPELPFSEDVFCQDIAKQRFLPALSQQGERIDGKYTVSIYVNRREASPNDARRPLIDDRPSAPPILHALAPRFDMMRFPPDGRWMRRFYRAPTSWKQAPQAGWQGAAEEEIATGLIVGMKDGERTCRAAKYPAEPSYGACRYALNALNPQWGDDAPAEQFGVPLWIVPNGDSFSAIGPIETPRLWARVSPEDSQALSTALTSAGVFPRGQAESPLRISLRSGADGIVTVCRILQSSGSDAGDLATCRNASAMVTVLPRQDFFGNALDRNTAYWRAAEQVE